MDSNEQIANDVAILIFSLSAITFAFLLIYSYRELKRKDNSSNKKGIIRSLPLFLTSNALSELIEETYNKKDLITKFVIFLVYANFASI